MELVVQLESLRAPSDGADAGLSLRPTGCQTIPPPATDGGNPPFPRHLRQSGMVALCRLPVGVWHSFPGSATASSSERGTVMAQLDRVPGPTQPRPAGFPVPPPREIAAAARGRLARAATSASCSRTATSAILATYPPEIRAHLPAVPAHHRAPARRGHAGAAGARRATARRGGCWSRTSARGRSATGARAAVERAGPLLRARARAQRAHRAPAGGGARGAQPDARPASCSRGSSRRPGTSSWSPRDWLSDAALAADLRAALDALCETPRRPSRRCPATATSWCAT